MASQKTLLGPRGRFTLMPFNWISVFTSSVLPFSWMVCDPFLLIGCLGKFWYVRDALLMWYVLDIHGCFSYFWPSSFGTFLFSGEFNYYEASIADFSFECAIFFFLFSFWLCAVVWEEHSTITLVMAHYVLFYPT